MYEIVLKGRKTQNKKSVLNLFNEFFFSDKRKKETLQNTVKFLY